MVEVHHYLRLVEGLLQLQTTVGLSETERFLSVMRRRGQQCPVVPRR